MMKTILMTKVSDDQSTCRLKYLLIKVTAEEDVMPGTDRAIHSKEYRYACEELDVLCRAGVTRGGLMDFHSCYKLVLLAHSQPEYREIGPLLRQSATGHP